MDDFGTCVALKKRITVLELQHALEEAKRTNSHAECDILQRQLDGLTAHAK